MLFFRSGMFVVGPESAGANPGPACYGKGKYIVYVVDSVNFCMQISARIQRGNRGTKNWCQRHVIVVKKKLKYM